jgi:hypothetical protein
MIGAIEEVPMTAVRLAALTSLGLVLGVQPVTGQSPFAYRAYALESSVASVAKITGTRESDTRTLHERPARIQEIGWRASYLRAGDGLADPVRDVVFGFYDDQLYRIFVTYDRDRMEGLTNDDVIESISATYGAPLLQDTGTVRDGRTSVRAPEAAILARWEDGTSLLTLTWGTYSAQYHLELVSKALNLRAGAAIKEALRLDAKEAPQRELDLREKRDEATRIAGQKARAVNKAAFRP